MYERQNKEMDQGGRNPSVQDHGADRGGHAAGGGNDHGGGLADRGRYGGVGRRGVNPDVLGRFARTGQGILTRDDPAVSRPQGQSGANPINQAHERKVHYARNQPQQHDTRGNQ